MENSTPQRLTPPSWSLAQPGLLYAGTWLVILGLTSLRLTVVLQPMTVAGYTLVLSSVFIALALTALVYYCFPALHVYSPQRVADDLASLYQLRKWLLVLWAIGSAFEVAVGRGVPLTWKLMGDTTRFYPDFGISSLHGLLVSFHFFISTVTALEIFLHGRTRRWWALGALTVWPMLLLSRGPLVLLLLEVLGVYLVCRRPRPRMVMSACAGALLVVITFGIIGDRRTSPEAAAAVRSVISDEARPIMDRLPSGAFWVYLYATTPINNVAAGLGRVEPSGEFYYSIVALVPTIVRERIFHLSERKFPLGLVNEAFNTSTWFVGFLADFGEDGALLGTSVLLLVAVMFYRSARVWRPWAIVGYAACFQGVVLSAFADTFTSLVTVLQLLIALVAGALSARHARLKDTNQ